jgi:hypothetical protein
MKIIPLQALPSQTVSVLLANQNCTINVYQKSTGMFLDLYVDSTLIIGGVIGQDRNKIVRDAYLGFVGDLAFIDSEGADDPVYTGLGGRFSLAYLEVSDLSAGAG